MAIRRFQQNHGDVSITLAANRQAFADVAAERLGSKDTDAAA